VMGGARFFGSSPVVKWWVCSSVNSARWWRTPGGIRSACPASYVELTNNLASYETLLNEFSPINATTFLEAVLLGQ
jgi:hypothetical protein